MNRQKRRMLLEKYPILTRIFNCNSKNELINILFAMPSEWKQFMKLYLEKFFIMHLHLRQIKEFSKLMAHRNYIYEAIRDPEILRGNMSFANNLVKNFCKGLVNFVVLFYDNLNLMHLL